MNTNSSNMCPIYYIKAYHWIQCWCLSYLCISQSVQWAQRQRDVSKQPFVYVLWAWDWRLAWNERKMRWAHYIVLKWRTKMHRIWLDYEQVDSFIAIYALCMNRIESHRISVCICRMTLKSNNREVDKTWWQKRVETGKRVKEIEKKNSFYSYNSIITAAATAATKEQRMAL